MGTPFPCLIVGTHVLARILHNSPLGSCFMPCLYSVPRQVPATPGLGLFGHACWFIRIPGQIIDMSFSYQYGYIEWIPKPKVYSPTVSNIMRVYESRSGDKLYTMAPCELGSSHKGFITCKQNGETNRKRILLTCDDLNRKAVAQLCLETPSSRGLTTMVCPWKDFYATPLSPVWQDGTLRTY